MQMIMVESKLNHVHHVCEKINEGLSWKNPFNTEMKEIRLDFNNDIIELNKILNYYVICPHCRIMYVKEIE